MNVLSLLTVAGAMFAAANFGLRTVDQDDGVEAGPAPDSVRYLMQSHGGDISCAVDRGRFLSAGVALLTVSPDCAIVLPGVEQAKFWRDVDKGAVAFSATGVDRIVTFGIADGAGYESFGADVPMISLAAAD